MKVISKAALPGHGVAYCTKLLEQSSQRNISRNEVTSHQHAAEPIRPPVLHDGVSLGKARLPLAGVAYVS